MLSIVRSGENQEKQLEMVNFVIVMYILAGTVTCMHGLASDKKEKEKSADSIFAPSSKHAHLVLKLRSEEGDSNDITSSKDVISQIKELKNTQAANSDKNENTDYLPQQGVLYKTFMDALQPNSIAKPSFQSNENVRLPILAFIPTRGRRTFKYKNFRFYNTRPDSSYNFGTMSFDPIFYFYGLGR